MDSRQIEESAATWIARRDGGNFSDADAAELEQWLVMSTAHRVAFIRLDNMWREANRLKALGAGVSSGVVPAPGEWQLSPFLEQGGQRTRVAPAEDASASALDADERAQPRRRWFARAGAFAASAVIAIAAVTTWYMRPAGSLYETRVGAVEAIDLSDGSYITLNTNSEIRVSMTETQRRIELKRGEAFFDVAKDSARPFAVTAGNQRVIAVGTKFSVRRAESGVDEVRVVVTEGRVRVGPATTGAGLELPPAEVVAGSVARSTGAGVLLDANPAHPVDEYLSWRNGYLVFRDTALRDAVAEFNRYNSTQLVVEDSAVAAIRIGGNFRSTNVDAFVRLLEDGFPIRVERRGAEIVLAAN